jgi:hypothetical protein
LFAAALDPGIESLYLSGGLVSFQSVVETEQYTQPFASFVPDLLNHTDLPDVAASVSPRRIILAGLMDAGGRTLALEAARGTYPAGNVTTEAAPEWSAARLLTYARADLA